MSPRYASLHSGLLARKGEALPSSPTRLPESYYADAKEAPTPPEPAPSHLQAVSNEAPAPARPRKPRRKSADPRRKLTLRLTPEQHRRLRIAAAQLDCSQQSLMVEALDALFEDLAQGQLAGCKCLDVSRD